MVQRKVYGKCYKTVAYMDYLGKNEGLQDGMRKMHPTIKPLFSFHFQIVVASFQGGDQHNRLWLW
jgi:hypothetical protein